MTTAKKIAVKINLLLIGSKNQMKKYIAIVHEKGQYDDLVKYEFDSFDERKWFLVSMRGVLICTEAYTEVK